MLAGRIVRGKYVRFDGHGTASPSRDISGDYYKGVKPSDLAHLDNRQLYLAAERLHDSIESGTGSERERNGAQEAYAAVAHERRARRSTIR